MLIGQRSADTEFVRSRPLCSADAQKENAQSRRRGGSCTGIGTHCRGKGGQACKTKCGGIVGCSSSRLWYRPAASGPFPPQLSHPHRTGAVGTATAAAPAAPDGATETGGSHPTVRLPAPPAGKPRARAAALCLPMCAPIRTACTRNLHPTALWGRLLRRLRLHRSSPPRRPRSSLPRRSGRCLPACGCARPVARARARSAGLRPGYGCSPAMPHWLRMPAMLKALRRKTTRVTCRLPPLSPPPPPLHTPAHTHIAHGTRL